MKPDAANSGDPQERKRLLELVAFARRTPDRPGFTWRHGVFFGLAALSLVAALRCWMTWRSFNRPVEVSAEPWITAAEQTAMIAAIQSSFPDLNPVAMDAAKFQSVLLGRGRIERSAVFVRQGRETRVTVRRLDGSPGNSRFPHVRIFTFDESDRLIGSEPFFPERSILCY